MFGQRGIEKPIPVWTAWIWFIWDLRSFYSQCQLVFWKWLELLTGHRMSLLFNGLKSVLVIWKAQPKSMGWMSYWRKAVCWEHPPLVSGDSVLLLLSWHTIHTPPKGVLNACERKRWARASAGPCYVELRNYRGEREEKRKPSLSGSHLTPFHLFPWVRKSSNKCWLSIF